VLGPNTFLTTAQISKLRRVPEVVFLNCCHLGSMDKDAAPRWGKLAANLATEFIEMGCKAVVAAGWSVEDRAASAFAQEFWQGMLRQLPFGEALRCARQQTYQGFPNSNTWGAYQAYGDQSYVLDGIGEKEPEEPTYMLKGHVISDLEQLKARIGPCSDSERDYYRKLLEKIETAIRARFYGEGEIRQLLAEIWSSLGKREKAIGHYQAAIAQENGGASLKAVEQLANQEIRLGQMKNDPALLESGRKRLETLLTIGVTVERLSLMASYWKHLEMIQTPDSEAVKLECLGKMLEQYGAASELSLAQGGDRDYYPTLNVLDGAMVLAGHGDPTVFNSLDGYLADWLADCHRNAERRLAVERNFFHAYAAVDAARIELMWPLLRPHAEPLPADSPQLLKLYEQHQAVFRLLGGANEQNSVTKQLNWLAERMPAGSPVHATLSAWLAKLS
jgi:tetratricopeptide (TPR) repeat protein